MADSASPILLQRIQSVGSNVNLWGGYINTDLQMVEQASKGYQTLAVTGDATIAWANYTLGNVGSAAFLKLTGSVTGVLTFPAYQNFLDVWNANSASVTIKCSGGTGVTLAAGQRALLFCDGTDYYNAAPNVLGSGTVTVSGRIAGVTAGAAATDAVNKTQMETAIATAGLPATAGAVLVSSNDTTAGYLAQKVTVGFSSATTTQLSGLISAQVEIANAGSDEKARILMAPGYVGAFLPGGVQTSQFTPSVGTEYTCDFTAASWTVDLAGMTSPQLEQRIKLNCFGNNPPFFLGTVNGQSNTNLPAGLSGELTYCGATWGWN